MGRSVQRFLRNPAAMLSSLYLAVVVFACTFASFLAPYGYDDRVPGGPLLGPGRDYLLGTDTTGRDILSRLMFGGQTSLRVIVAVVALALTVSVPIGIVAGFRAGRIDYVTMRAVEVASSVPPLVLAICIAGILGPGVNNLILALAVVLVPGLVRLVRAQALGVGVEPFIEASKSIGTPARRIASHRVWPNVRSVVIVQLGFLLSGALLSEASLSFLGLGAQPPTPTWGNMLRQAYETSLFTAPWQVVAPALVLTATVFAFNTLADGLRDASGLGSVGAASVVRRKDRQIGLTAVGPRERPRRAEAAGADAPLLEVNGLSIEFDGDHGPVRVVDNVSFTVRKGEVVGLVGESGCGKSVTSLAIVRLLTSPPARIVAGSVRLNGRELLDLKFAEMRRIRGSEIAMVFQDSLSGLDPAFTIGDLMVEAIRMHQRMSRKAARARATELIELVGIPAPERRLDDYPHQLSGGMRQRVMIAAALAAGPRLLIADEPTTALDVTVQAEILELLKRLQTDLGMGLIFITHDLGVVAEICDRALVMYAGQIVEEAPVRELFAAPRHPYTRGLLRSMPQIGSLAERLPVIPGEVPMPSAWPVGCRFGDRCEYVSAVCTGAPIEFAATSTGRVRCVRQAEILAGIPVGPMGEG